jgi:uncharacterized membrane protein
VEAFSDGVFAIAIALLILTVTPPTHALACFYVLSSSLFRRNVG